jgi:hypothetical protein
VRSAFALLATLFLVSACASPPERRVMAETLVAEMYAAVPHVIDTHLVPRREDASTAAPGQPGGYRRAAFLRDARLSCGAPDGVECGAKIEVFKNERRAKLRSTVLEARNDASSGERVLRRGAVLLRTSGELTRSEAREYEQALDRAVAALTERLAEKADLLQE